MAYADRGGWRSHSPGESVTKVQSSMLLALRGVGDQARSQDLKRGGSFSVSADRRIGVYDPIFPAGCRSGGAVSPPVGSGAVPWRQMHFDNNLSTFCLKNQV